MISICSPDLTSIFPPLSASSSLRNTCTVRAAFLRGGVQAHFPISMKFMGTPSSQSRPAPSPRRYGLLPMPIMTLAITEVVPPEGDLGLASSVDSTAGAFSAPSAKRASTLRRVSSGAGRSKASSSSPSSPTLSITGSFSGSESSSQGSPSSSSPSSSSGSSGTSSSKSSPASSSRISSSGM